MNINIKAELNKEIRNIEILINQNRFQDAYNNCNKLLLNFPDDSKLIKLKTKIEKIVFKHNLINVKKDLKSLKPLWKEKKYDELVARLTEIVKYVPGYNKAEKALYKAQNLYRNQIQYQQKETLASYIRTIEQSIKSQDYQKAISLCRDVLRKIPQHEKCGILYAKAKNLLIDKEIGLNQSLLNSNKFDEIEEFLKSLQKIAPDSIRIKNMLNKTARREKISVEFAKKDFIYNAYDKILIMYQKGKYDKTLEALRELIEVDPDNLKALELFKNAEKKFSSQLDREVTAKIRLLQKKYREEKKKFPSNFIRL